MQRVILHCDLNNFFATVEILLNPELSGKPMAVCGDQELRHGIILAKSNEAKKLGVKTAEQIWQAKEKCKDLICVEPHFRWYKIYSDRVFAIYSKYTEKIERFGIDECWLDVTDSVKLFGDGKTIANKLRQEVKEQLGLTISVGVSFNKVFAKLGSDMRKPDATTVIDEHNYKNTVWALPSEDMIGVGKHMKPMLNKYNIRTIGDLANMSNSIAKSIFGTSCEYLINCAKGIDTTPVMYQNEYDSPKSIGNGVTLARDLSTIESCTPIVSTLADSVCSRLRLHSLKANVVQIVVKNQFFDYYVRQIPMAHPSSSTTIIAKYAMQLLKENHKFNSNNTIRNLTVRVSSLIPEQEEIQTSLFSENIEEKHIDYKIDKIRSKFGSGSIKLGVIINNEGIDEYYNDDE